MKNSFGVYLAAVLGVLTISSVLFAHHGSSVLYDPANRITLKGTVTRFLWSNPHAQIYFDVKDDEGRIVHWGGELNSPAGLTKGGWTRYSLRPGDQITISLALSKAPKAHVGLVGQVVLPNGQFLQANHVLTPESYGTQ